MTPGPRICAIEAGGTKVVCSVGSSPEELAQVTPVVVATADPEVTMAEVAAWLRAADADHHVDAVGIASFGPVNLAAQAISMSTPKLAWRGFSWATAIGEVLGVVPVGFETDTNAACLAEATMGAGRGDGVVAYLTVGTGIGGGLVLEGRPLHGLVHPEFGHLRIARQPEDHFAGSCPIHGDCFEGLAAGPAIEARWGSKGEQLEPGHPAWALEARYLAQGIVDIIAIASPHRVIVGGGVAGVPGLLDGVRGEVVDLLAGYLPHPSFGAAIEHYLVPPGLGDRSGVIGAWLVGHAAWEQAGSN